MRNTLIAVKSYVNLNVVHSRVGMLLTIHAQTFCVLKAMKETTKTDALLNVIAMKNTMQKKRGATRLIVKKAKWSFMKQVNVAQLPVPKDNLCQMTTSVWNSAPNTPRKVVNVLRGNVLKAKSSKTSCAATNVKTTRCTTKKKVGAIRNLVLGVKKLIKKPDNAFP
jgi:hypothetical protein